MTLIVGRAYYLSGMKPDMWSMSHPRYGKPFSLGGRYLGCLHGARRWHGFEVWVDGKDAGVIFMPDEDLAQLHITEVAD